MVSSMNRISGMASGMDIDTMVKNLMAARRKPLDKLIANKQIMEWQREDYLNLNTKIWDYRNNKLFNFKLEGNLNSRVATSGNTDVATVKATGDAQIGSISIKVNNVATAATNISAGDIRATGKTLDPNKTLASQKDNLGATLTEKIPNTTPPTYENFEIKINGQSVTINPNEDSLNAVINKINKSTSVTAFYAEGKVSFVAKQTGSVNGEDKKQANISFKDVKGNFLGNVLKITNPGTAANNASVDINGIPNVSQTSNTFSVNGVEITLNSQAAAGSTSTITVKTDTDKLIDSIKGFINDYNDMLKTMQDKVSEKRNRDYLPLTEDQKKDMKDSDVELWTTKARSGLLKNDSIFSTAINDMRMAATSQVDTGSSKYKTLSSIGIETGDYSEKGKLYLTNESKLRTAIEENPDAVIAMFTANGEPGKNGKDVGIAERIYAKLQVALDDITKKAGASSTGKDNSILGKQLKEYDTDIYNWNQRLNDIEDRYYKQFTAMETAINKYNSQSGYLANAFK